MTTYLVLLVFTSSPFSLLATTKASVFLYSMYASAQYINISVLIQLKQNDISLHTIITTQLNRLWSAHVKAACTKTLPLFCPF